MTATLSKLTAREFDHLIAALRVYQTMLEMHSAVCQDVEDIATEHGAEMSPEEIDALVLKLNCGTKGIAASTIGANWGDAR